MAQLSRWWRLMPHIRAALRTHFPEASSWTEWQHQSNSVTTLPSGCEFSTDRGAEQGDVLGTIQSALVLGDARASHLQDFLSSPFEQKGVCDEWFVDDGQCFVRPMLFDRWLRALDSALAPFGATRGRIALGNAKSSARLLCPPERFHEFSGWDTAYVCDTVVVLSLTLAQRLLGRLLALVSKSTPALGSQCAPATSCAPPSTEWIMHPQNSC